MIRDKGSSVFGKSGSLVLNGEPVSLGNPCWRSEPSIYKCRVTGILSSVGQNEEGFSGRVLIWFLG